MREVQSRLGPASKTGDPVSVNDNDARYSIDEILSNSWDKKLAKDLADEIGASVGDRIDTVREMRRFLAVKGYRELLQRVRDARAGKIGGAAVAAVAHAMRNYALDRPALSAAAFRTAAADCPEWRQAHERLHLFMMDMFAECGLVDDPAEHALEMLRSLVRGYVLHEVMHTFVGVEAYDESFESAVRVFVAGIPALVSHQPRYASAEAPDHEDQPEHRVGPG